MEEGILYHQPINDISNQSEVTTEAGLETTEGKLIENDTPAQNIQTIVLPTIYAIVCIIGLIGNGLVIYIMHLKARNRNITDLYVLNLATADFIFVAMLPFWAIDIALNKRWIFGRILCKLTSGSTYFHMYASVFFLTAMSVDRFLAVVMYQTSRKYRTKITTTVGVVIIWLLSTLLGLLPLFFRDVEYIRGTPSCDWIFNSTIPSHADWFLTYVISRSILGFALPFFIILISYSLIILFLKTRKTRGKLAGKCQDRATRMVLVVIAVFLLCWLPNQISNLIYVAQTFRIMEEPRTPSMVHYYIHMFSTCLAWIHSCINPILYAFMREDLRVKLTEIMNHWVKRCCGAKSSQELAMKLQGRKLGATEQQDPERLKEQHSATQSMRPAKENDENIDKQNDENQGSQAIVNVYYDDEQKDCSITDPLDEECQEPITANLYPTSKNDEEQTRLFDGEIEVHDVKREVMTNSSDVGVRTNLLGDDNNTELI